MLKDFALARKTLNITRKNVYYETDDLPYSIGMSLRLN